MNRSGRIGCAGVCWLVGWLVGFDDLFVANNDENNEHYYSLLIILS